MLKHINDKDQAHLDNLKHTTSGNGTVSLPTVHVSRIQLSNPYDCIETTNSQSNLVSKSNRGQTEDRQVEEESDHEEEEEEELTNHREADINTCETTTFGDGLLFD